MGVDKHTLQQWVAGAELKVKKTHQPFSKLPLANRVKKVAEHTQTFVFTEKIDLTRAQNFRMQESSEDILFASVQLPLLGKKSLGNDIGMAVASFDYTDRDGDEHSVIAVCAYVVSGVVKKVREARHILIIPMV